MAKKPTTKTNLIHDFVTESIFQGRLISEGPEYFTFESDEDEPEMVDIPKTPELINALKTTFNEVEVRKSDLVIIIEYLGEGTNKKGEKYDKFSVSVDAE